MYHSNKGLKDGPSICKIAPKIIPSPQVGLSLKIVPETHLPISYTGTSQATRKGASREEPGPPGFHFFADVNPGKDNLLSSNVALD